MSQCTNGPAITRTLLSVASALSSSSACVYPPQQVDYSRAGKEVQLWPELRKRTGINRDVSSFIVLTCRGFRYCKVRLNSRE